MATISTIEWTEMTWNPVTGCRKITAGCKQWGGVRKDRTGRELNGRTYDEMPSIGQATMAGD